MTGPNTLLQAFSRVNRTNRAPNGHVRTCPDMSAKKTCSVRTCPLKICPMSGLSGLVSVLSVLSGGHVRKCPDNLSGHEAYRSFAGHFGAILFACPDLSGLGRTRTFFNVRTNINVRPLSGQKFKTGHCQGCIFSAVSAISHILPRLNDEICVFD